MVAIPSPATFLTGLGNAALAYLAMSSGLPQADARDSFRVSRAPRRMAQTGLELSPPTEVAPFHDCQGNTHHRNLPPNTAVLVSHYNEDLSWLEGHERQAIVYSKGPDALTNPGYAHLERLPNIGCEGHTYLTYIVDYYDRLPNITLFSQGRIDDCVPDFKGLGDLLDRAQQNSANLTFYRAPDMFEGHQWDGLDFFDKWAEERDSGILQRANKTPREHYRWLFDEEPPEKLTWIHTAVFAVNKAAIQAHPKWFYERALSAFVESNHPKPELGHYHERWWRKIFEPDAA